MSSLPNHIQREATASVLARFDPFHIEPDQRAALENSRLTFKQQAQFILINTKPGREQSLALTALEEAKYWTNQSIAKDGVPE